MRKFLFSIIGVVLLVLISISWADEKKYPAPWSKVKENAILSGKTMERGTVNVWRVELKENGQGVVYVMVWAKTDDSIGIIKICEDEIKMVGCGGTSNDYEWFITDNPSIVILINEDEAIRKGFEFFRELVSHNLL